MLSIKINFFEKPEKPSEILLKRYSKTPSEKPNPVWQKFWNITSKDKTGEKIREEKGEEF